MSDLTTVATVAGDAPPYVRDVLAAGLAWLYTTEQPTAAVATHHGVGVLAGDRRYRFVFNGTSPIVVVSVARPVYRRDFDLVNGLRSGELDQVAELLAELGHRPVDQWNGTPGSEHGTVKLATPPHPSLLAASRAYYAGCPDHGSVFCAQLAEPCPWWSTGHAAIVKPQWPDLTSVAESMPAYARDVLCGCAGRCRVCAWIGCVACCTGSGHDREHRTIAEAVYVEEWVCLATPPGEEDHEHDPKLPCEWRFRCSLCHRFVDAEPCPDHAPRDVPGLRLADCEATPQHVTFGHLREDYGMGCPYCQIAVYAERERLARQCRHWPWRRWAISHWVEGWAYRLGIISGGGTSWGDGCNRCLSGIHFRGERPYILGAARTTWRCWSKGHRRGAEVGFGYCGVCVPWTCCGSTGVDHTPACPEVNSDQVNPLTVADVARIFDVPAELLDNQGGRTC